MRNGNLWLVALCVISDQSAQEIIDRAMASSSLKQRNVVGVITGLTGSGKTTLLHHLFGLPPPGLYTSTGVLQISPYEACSTTLYTCPPVLGNVCHTMTSVLS